MTKIIIGGVAVTAAAFVGFVAIVKRVNNYEYRRDRG